MIKRAVSHDGTVVYDAGTKDKTPRCPKCQAPHSSTAGEFHYVTCPLHADWQRERRTAREAKESKMETNNPTPPPDVTAVTPMRVELVFEPHPEAPGLTICTLDGCVVGGVGDTKEQALFSFVKLINRLEAGKQMSIQALAVATGRAELPMGRPVEAPKQAIPLIIPATSIQQLPRR